MTTGDILGKGETDSEFIALREHPLLIFKIGVLGCAPLDMPTQLANDYGMRLISSDQIRKEIMDDRDAQGMDPIEAQNVSMNAIRHAVADRATPMLEDGDDVVLDMFFNTPKSRTLPRTIAEQSGALTVALWFKTSVKVAYQRVEQWTQEDAFKIPVSRWDIPPIQAVRRMADHTVKPHREGIDFVCHLYGANGTTDIIDQFDSQMGIFGLLDPDPSD